MGKAVAVPHFPNYFKMIIAFIMLQIIANERLFSYHFPERVVTKKLCLDFNAHKHF